MIDLDALEAARNEADEEKVADVLGFLILARNALPELIRLARIGQRVERGDSFVAICGPNKGIV